MRYALRDSDPQLAEKPISERARLCYLWDRALVEWADVLVADVSFPGIGLGIELQIAEARDTPILLCFEDGIDRKVQPVRYETPDRVQHSLQIGDGYVSLMALGLPSVFRVIAYRDAQHAYSAVAESLSVLTAN